MNYINTRFNYFKQALFQTTDKQSEKAQDQKLEVKQKLDPTIRMRKSTSFDIISQCSEDTSNLKHSNNELCITNKALNQIYESIRCQDYIIIGEEKLIQNIKLLEKENWKEVFRTNRIDCSDVDLRASLMMQNIKSSRRKNLWDILCNKNINDQNKQKLVKFYRSHKLIKNKYSNQISIDCKRTQFSNIFFRNPQNLESFNEILNAYALQDKELGYSQGMNIIVANLLLCLDKYCGNLGDSVEILDDYNDRDENVFVIFNYMMIQKKWRLNFMDGFPGLQKGLFIIEQRIQNEIPQLFQHLTNEGGDMMMYFGQLYLSSMMQNSPLDFNVMMLDLFLSGGEQIVHQMLIGILIYFKDQMIKMDLAQLIKFINYQMIENFNINLVALRKQKDVYLLTLDYMGLLWMDHDQGQQMQKRRRSNSPFNIVQYSNVQKNSKFKQNMNSTMMIQQSIQALLNIFINAQLFFLLSLSDIMRMIMKNVKKEIQKPTMFSLLRNKKTS